MQGDGCRAGLDPPWARRNGGSRPALPAGERVRGEREVVVARVIGDLGAQTRRMLDALIGGVELDLRHHQAGVVAVELVHVPQMTGALYVVAALVDQPAQDGKSVAQVTSVNLGVDIGGRRCIKSKLPKL